jgi:hypothetical protein
MNVSKLTDKEADPTAGAGSTRFIHNSDFSGCVTIERTVNGEKKEIDIPYWQLQQLVVTQVRSNRVNAIENASSEEILGLAIRDCGLPE